MSLWSRIWNVVRGDRLHSEIDAEFESHIQEAIAHGRDSDEARRAFGPRLLMRENVLDFSLIPWLESLRADAIFGWRQLKKSKITSAAAILSLALALGACTSAFRLIDATLLRPLPVANAEHLYELSRQAVFDSAPVTSDAWAYPNFLPRWHCSFPSSRWCLQVLASMECCTITSCNNSKKSAFASPWVRG